MPAPCFSPGGKDNALLKRRRGKQLELAPRHIATVQLVQPLSLLGNLTVGLTAGQILSPETVLQVLFDISSLNILRAGMPDLHAAFRAVAPSARLGRAPRADLRARVLAACAARSTYFDLGEVAAALANPQHPVQGLDSPWRLLLQGFEANATEAVQDPLGSLWHQSLQWLVASDEQLQYAWHLYHVDSAAGEDYLTQRLGPSLDAWKRSGSVGTARQTETTICPKSI